MSQVSSTTDRGAQAHGIQNFGRRSRSIERHVPAVLIVDDNADNLLALEAALRRDDVEILTADSARAALQLLLERDIAVAIIDVMMPEIDGFELAELIRGVDRTRRVPIIFVTAGSKADFGAFSGYETGAIDFLFKPLSERVLQAKVDVLVALERQRQEIDAARRQAERSRQETELLFRLAQATGQCDKPEDVHGPALDAVHEILGADASGLLLFGADEAPRFRSGRGAFEAAAADLEPNCPRFEAERAPRPVLIGDLGADAAETYRSRLLERGVRALGFVPLVSERRILGTLVLGWDRARAFSEHEANLALTIASHAAGAIERLRLRDAERSARVTAEAAEQKLLMALNAREAVVVELKQTLHYNEIFAGILAHDLRSPLGAITAAAQLMRFGRKDEGTGQWLDRILRSAARMHRMIEQLLDFTRSRVGGGFELVPRSTDLAQLCRQAVSELALAHSDWAIRVDVCGDSIGTWDADRILQIASNVIGNAGQHGRPGAEILVQLDGTRPDGVALRVRNEGAISAAALGDPFSPFRRRREAHAGGLGLGLFITRELVVAHGGTIEVDTAEPEVTTFSIWLPRHVRLADAAPSAP